MEVLALVRNVFSIYTPAKIGLAGRVSLLTGTGFVHINRALGRKKWNLGGDKNREEWRETSLFLLSQFSW